MHGVDQGQETTEIKMYLESLCAYNLVGRDGFRTAVASNTSSIILASPS